MQIVKGTVDANGLMNVSLTGRLDTLTAPELEAQLKGKLAGVKTLRLELKELEYLSSAGLRVLLSAMKEMKAQGGELVITHPTETVMEIFEVTGFRDILTIQD